MLQHFSGEQRSAIDSIVERARADFHATAVSVAIARGGDMLYARGFGIADPARKIPATATTVYAIGSITKQFTAALVMQLVQEDAVDLDALVQTYLPQAPHAGEITVRHLLDQRSGLANYLADPFTVAQYAQSTRVTPGQLLEGIAREPLRFSPGTAWEYSNSNYVVLGALVEKLRGRPYAAVIEERIVGPLRLEATSFAAPPPGPDIAAGMAWSGATKSSEPQPRWSSQCAYAAGALNSTVCDLVAWDAALFAGQVVAADAVAQMTTPPRLPNGRDTDYAFGWIVGEMYGHKRVWHNGGIPGFSAQNSVFPDAGIAIVVLANEMAFDGGQLVKQIFAQTGAVTAAERDADEHPKPAAGEDAAITVLAKAQYEAFQNGTIDPSTYTDPMRAALTPAMIDQVRAGLEAAGSIVSMALVDRRDQAGIALFTYTIVCERTGVKELIGIDRAGKIAALYFRPA